MCEYFTKIYLFARVTVYMLKAYIDHCNYIQVHAYIHLKVNINMDIDLYTSIWLKELKHAHKICNLLNVHSWERWAVGWNISLIQLVFMQSLGSALQASQQFQALNCYSLQWYNSIYLQWALKISDLSLCTRYWLRYLQSTTNLQRSKDHTHPRGSWLRACTNDRPNSAYGKAQQEVRWFCQMVNLFLKWFPLCSCFYCSTLCC